VKPYQQILIVGFLAAAPAASFGAALAPVAPLLPATAPASPTISNPLLFSVVKDGRESFVFGLFHQTVRAEDLPKAVWAAVDESHVFVNEVDQAAPVPMELLVAPDGRSLSDQLRPESRQKLQRLMPGAPDHLLPALPYIQYLEGAMRQAVGQGLDPQTLLDFRLREYALSRGKEIQFLDRIENVVGRYTRGVTAELLDWTLSRLCVQEFSDAFVAQRNAYLAGDLDRHAALFESAHFDFHMMGLYKLLITMRNQEWAPKLTALHGDRSFFLAVGAGHLGGQDSLLKRLAQEGFSVRRLP
jgi:uncharacterized protein YbaP (TraB family)